MLSMINEEMVQIKRTEEFTKIAKELGDYINKLDLRNDHHNEIVDLIIKQVKQGEKDAFLQGIDLGIGIAMHREEA